MRISVIGAGGWGTALARLAARQHHQVRLWAYEAEVVDSIRNRRVNEIYLPGVELPATLEPTNDLAEATRDAEVVLTAVPSQHLRKVLEQAAPHVPADALFVSATKGIEENSLLRMSQVIEQVMNDRLGPGVVALSGPTFAREVAEDRPTALVAASNRPNLAEESSGGAVFVDPSRLHQRRRRWCGTGGSSQERHRHRGRGLRGTESGTQSGGRAHHTRISGDLSFERCPGRAEGKRWLG